MSTESLTSYLAMDRCQALARGAVLPEWVRGAALFADISGFTPLTEALARTLGPRLGAEELTVHLNRVYEALIEEVHRFGGSVIAFAGDAITCWFDGDDGRRALASGLAMQQAMQRLGVVRLPDGASTTLAMKASVAVGPARRMAVGDPDISLIDVLAGRTLSRMGDGGHVAQRGEVVIDAPSLAGLDGLAVVAGWHEQGGSRFGIVTGLTVEVAPTPWPVAGDLPDEAVRPWLLPAIYRRLREGRGEFLTELRPAVSFFIKFGDIDFDTDPDGARKLNAWVTYAQRTLDRHHGFLIDMSVGDKGCYLCSAFGAPIAQEDDPRRALAAALDIHNQPAELAFVSRVQMGLSQGTMRTGAYGSTARRTYGVLGDEVNLAARLMERAEPGQILVSERLQARSAEDFVWESLAPFKPKGKSQALRVFGLVSTRHHGTGRFLEPSCTLPIVGRQAELEALHRCLGLATSGHGQVVTLTAEAGMGKSRLIAEFLHRHVGPEWTVQGGQCQSSGTRTSYLVWWSVCRRLFDLPENVDAADALAPIARRLGSFDPTWALRLPLLGAVLNLPLPDNELTAGFDAKLRKTSLEALVVGCLRRFARQHPLLLILDDVHWIDPLSLDLAEAVARSGNDVPLLLLVLQRPPQGGGPAAPPFAGLPHHTGVALPPLARDEAREFLLAKAQQLFGPDVSLSAPIITQLLERAEGNPFYLEELLQYLHDQRVSPDTDAALRSLELPNTLHSLILSRIDRLKEEQKITLKVASVIGRSFPADLVVRVHPQRNPARVMEDLADLNTLDLTPRERPAPDLSYIFKHVVTQEVAYESLSYAVRAELHNEIGLQIERERPDSPDEQISLLAFHFARSRNEEKKLEYLLRAGDLAQARYANAAAIDYYERALPLLEPDRRIAVLLSLGGVLELVGRWPEAGRRYTEALDLARQGGTPSQEARCSIALAELARKQGDFETVTRWLDHARGLYEGLHDPSGLAETLHVAGTTAAMQGRYDEASEFYYESMFLRRQLRDDAKTASLLSNLGIMAYYRGELASAGFFYEGSLNIRRRLGDRRAVANSLNNLGLVLSAQHDFASARRMIEESLAISRELGDRWSAANALSSLAETALDQGDLAAARAYLLESLKINRRLGDRTAIAFVLEIGAKVAAGAGRHADSIELAAAARTLRETIGSPLSPAEQQRLDEALTPARHGLPPAEQAAAEARAGSGPPEDVAERLFTQPDWAGTPG